MLELTYLLITPAMLLGAWITGTLLERRHFEDLLRLESGAREVLAVTIEDVPEGWEVEDCSLVLGNVVISQDYFKRVAASIKGIFVLGVAMLMISGEFDLSVGSTLAVAAYVFAILMEQDYSCLP